MQRKRALLERQKEGKARLRAIGSIRVDKDVFVKVLRKWKSVLVLEVCDILVAGLFFDEACDMTLYIAMFLGDIYYLVYNLEFISAIQYSNSFGILTIKLMYEREIASIVNVSKFVVAFTNTSFATA